MSVARDLGDAIVEYQAARAVRDEERASCERDWDYFGAHYEHLLDYAADRLSTAMDAYLADHADRHREKGEDD